LGNNKQKPGSPCNMQAWCGKQTPARPCSRNEQACNGSGSNGSCRNGQGGFILLYVLVMIAAIAIILMKLGQLQSPVPLSMEKKLNHEVQQREELLLLDFIIAGMKAQNLPTDPRYLQYQQILAASPRPSSEMDDQVAWLKSMLEQFKFKINGRDRADTATDKKNTPGQAATGDQSPKAAQGVLFQVRKEPYKLKLGQTEYSIHLLPANALPNLNAISFEALNRYLAVLGIPDNETKELAAALIDWRDPDNFKTEGIGAESEYYGNLQLPYAPRNAPIRTWQELNYVRGMTPQRVQLFRGSFTLGVPGATEVSAEYASPETMAALTGLKLETVKDLLKAYITLNEKGADVSRVLFSEDATLFESAVTWITDTNMARIRIESPENILTADYDIRNKRIVAWW
jgi:type II secretory pathway component PulK